MNETTGASDSSLEFIRFSPEWKSALASFLTDLKEHGDEKYFHPHSFSEDYLEKLGGYHGSDIYCIAVEGNMVIAYGMLRGWDAGYTIPSLGIAVHPLARGVGMAKAFMNFLHIIARRRGASQIRLKVYPENKIAVELYKSLGYIFQDKEDQQLIGKLTFK